MTIWMLSEKCLEGMASGQIFTAEGAENGSTIQYCKWLEM